MPIEQETRLAEGDTAEQAPQSRHITSPSLKGNPDELRDLEAGLDKLQSDAHRKARIDWTRIILPIAALLVLILAWQFYVSLGFKRRDQVPGPLDVLSQFGSLWAEGKAQEAVWTSLQRGVIGFLISVAVATPVGLLLAQVQPLRRAFGPLISGLQVLPSVAWVPAAIIWFGLSDGTVYFVVLMGAIPSIINGLISGVDQIPPQYRSVGKVLGPRDFRWPCRSSCRRPSPGTSADSSRAGLSPGAPSWPPKSSRWAAPSASGSVRSWTRAAPCPIWPRSCPRSWQSCLWAS
ncbi:bicarbonate transport system permease protein CmpB [Arthrobacter sp. Hiyo8]|nr:bicarbonate transport system permease protein CmpB [Arthrobacter sp. Hiyo8]